MNGVKRDCRCPIAQHRHGSERAYQSDRCRCTECLWAHRMRRRADRRAAAIARWNGQTSLVSSLGTARRIQALAADGWTMREIGDELGVKQARVCELRQVLYGLVNRRTAERVQAVYERLGIAPFDRDHNFARAVARRNGYAPSAAWDDDALDDPDAEPYTETATVEPLLDEVAVERFMAGHHAPLPPLTRSPERIEAIRRLAAAQFTDSEIGERVGMSRDAVCQIRVRHGIASTVPAAEPWHATPRVRRRTATGTERVA